MVRFQEGEKRHNRRRLLFPSLSQHTLVVAICGGICMVGTHGNYFSDFDMGVDAGNDGIARASSPMSDPVVTAFSLIPHLYNGVEG
jgi:hypothetical protein